MEDDAPVIYGLEFQARALTPQTAETDAIRFLVGTQSLKYDNQEFEVYSQRTTVCSINAYSSVKAAPLSRSGSSFVDWSSFGPPSGQGSRLFS